MRVKYDNYIIRKENKRLLLLHIDHIITKNLAKCDVVESQQVGFTGNTPLQPCQLAVAWEKVTEINVSVAS